MQPERALGAIVVLILLVVMKVGSVAMAVWLHTVFPDDMARVGTLYRTRATRCFMVGLVNATILFVVGLLLVSTQVLALLGLAIWAAVIAVSIYGYAVAYRQLGEHIVAPASSMARTVALGGLTAETAFFTPVLGQVFSLGVFFRGIGAFILARLSKGLPAEKAAEAEDEA